MYSTGVECYGAWGPEALKAFSQVATCLAIRWNTYKSKALANLYGRLSHSLIRAALLTFAPALSAAGGRSLCVVLCIVCGWV